MEVIIVIKLIVPDYCHSCTDFEPSVTQRPAELRSSCGYSCLYGDTIVECQYRNRCDAIYDYLKKEGKNNGSC